MDRSRPGEGGEWEFCRANHTNGGSYFASEVDSVTESLPQLAQEALRAELRGLMLRAMRGELAFRPRPEDAGEVALMAPRERQQRVLEMILNTQRGDEGDQQTRMYFTEPAHERDVLLGLLVAWKRPGPIGLDEQDAHIDLAHRRIDDHYGVFPPGN